MLPPLLGLDAAALTRALGGPGRARIVHRTLARGLDPLQDPEVPAGLRHRLSEAASFIPLRRRTSTRAADGTTKLLLELEDGRHVECVRIPERDRSTLCVSSQVGCRRGCTFCLTATMGLVRNLSVEEIVGQVYAGLAMQEDLPKLRNLVFMGMGEPLDNPVAVEAALTILTDDRAFGFAPRHVTVSTVGPSPAAIRRARDWPGHLAWSLHAGDDELRKTLVPTQRAGVEVIRDALAEVCMHRRQPLFVEIALLRGINDGTEAADRAAELLADFPNQVRFNLLPMNPVAGSPHQPSTPERARAFQARLQSKGFFASLRRARGEDARAACGQLAVLA